MQRKIVATLALSAALLWAGPAAADSFRCGTKLMSDGDSTDKVEALCGPPTSIQRRQILQRPVYYHHGRPYYSGYGLSEVTVEYWTYNLGPNKLMRRLRFEDGLLVDVETLSHGYHSASVD
ncbi:MAG TPA: DUF2845 domain-containing protein [Steroidobacteraceae bacterium]